MTMERLRELINEARALGPPSPVGRPPRDEGERAPASSSSIVHSLRRLMRDRPEVFEQLEAGEFRSVNQAMIFAGLKQSRLQCVMGQVSKMSDDERMAFMRWLDNEMKGTE